MILWHVFMTFSMTLMVKIQKPHDVLSPYFDFVDSSVEVSFLWSLLQVLIIYSLLLLGPEWTSTPTSSPCMRNDKWVGNNFFFVFCPVVNHGWWLTHNIALPPPPPTQLSCNALNKSSFQGEGLCFCLERLVMFTHESIQRSDNALKKSFMKLFMSCNTNPYSCSIILRLNTYSWKV